MKTLKSILFMAIGVLLMACDNDDDSNSFVDLSAEELSYSLVSQTNATTGVVRISGKIKNIGNTRYSSTAQQQYAAIYEKPLGTSTETELGTLNFTNLNAGEETTFFFDRNWDIAIEFQPEFILRIVLDPDILLDDNDANDDTNSANNSITIQGNDINNLFN